MKTSQIKNILSKLNSSPSKWELDSIVYYDRTSNPVTLAKFLTRIQDLQSFKNKLDANEQQELVHLLELLEEL